MRTVRTRSSWMVVLGTLAVMGCSGSQAPRDFVLNFNDTATGQPVTLRQGPMPQGFNWTGVYQSPQIGQIELVQTGDSVIGIYEYDRGSCHVTARVEGSITGNLVRYQWTENHRPCGRLAPVVGRAYFIFWADDDNHRGRIDGEWGYDQADRGGGHWGGFQLHNRRPRALEEGQGGGAPTAPSEPSSGGENSPSGTGGGM